MSLNWTPIEDAFEIIRNGISIKQDDKCSGIPITRIETISNREIDTNKLGYANILNDQYSDFYLIKGDILMSHINSLSHLGKTALVGDIGNNIIHGMNLLLLRSNKTLLNPAYANYYFGSPLFIKDLIKISNQSVNQCSFSISNLKNIRIPLPPLPIQKRIAEILDAADALKRKDQELLKKYDELAQAIFIDMFGDIENNEKGWEMKTIEQIVRKQKNSIKRGPFGGALKKEIFVNDGYLVYEQYHALNNDFSFGRYFITDEKYKELIGFKVEPDDIIISCSGVYLGKLAIIPKDAKEGIINQALLKLTLDQNIYKNDFFVAVFSQKNFKEKYFDSDRGAAIPNFPPMSAFKEFKFIAPPIELQEKYIGIVKNIQSSLEIMDKCGKSKSLFNSLIQKAFKGELVT